MATTITTLPDAPSRADPATFSSKSDALLGALATFVTETNTVAGECVSNAAIATTQAGLATTNGAAQVSLATAQVVLATEQVALATTQATNSANSATASANSALVAGAIAWVSGTTYAIGDTRYSPIDFQTYRRTTSGAGTTDPSADSANWTKALVAGVTSVTNATTATTLTSTPTLLKITPASYGVAVTLPDATTCSVGGPVHIVDNKGAYVVRLLNSDGTVRGFCPANEVTTISLIDNSTAVGVWAMDGGNIGVSAQLLSVLRNVDAVIDIGSSQEVIVGRGQTSANCYAVVYNRSTNTFGSATLVRTATFGTSLIKACLSGSNQVLVTSVPTASSAFEAVTLSISGTTITVNTAATATLSANINKFGDGLCGLLVVGSAFVTSYTVATPAVEIRAISISGTTVTISNAAVPTGTALGLMVAASSSIVIVASTATTHLYTQPYTISGSATPSVGTGTDTNSGTMTLNKFAALGSRWVVLYNDGGSTCKGGIVSLSGTTTTISTVTLFAASTITDAIVLSSSKVLVLNAATTSNANILMDTAGTAGAGTAITTTEETSRYCVAVVGTDAYTQDGTIPAYLIKLDCAGTSPVLTSVARGPGAAGSQGLNIASNSLLERAADILSTSTFVTYVISKSTPSSLQLVQWRNGEFVVVPNSLATTYSFATSVRGLSSREAWIGDNKNGILKTECAA